MFCKFCEGVWIHMRVLLSRWRSPIDLVEGYDTPLFICVFIRIHQPIRPLTAILIHRIAVSSARFCTRYNNCCMRVRVGTLSSNDEQRTALTHPILLPTRIITTVSMLTRTLLELPPARIDDDHRRPRRDRVLEQRYRIYLHMVPIG